MREQKVIETLISKKEQISLATQVFKSLNFFKFFFVTYRFNRTDFYSEFLTYIYV